MSSFITPEQAFMHYEDKGIGQNVIIRSKIHGKIHVNHAGRKVTKDNENNRNVCRDAFKHSFGRDHRNRFVYSNGWNTNDGRKSVCKEDDVNWNLIREQEYNNHPRSDPCFNVFIAIFLFAFLSVLSSNFVPR